MLVLLPHELLARVVALLPSPEECVRLERVGTLFRGPPWPSAVQAALRQRVEEAGGSVEAPAAWTGTMRGWLVFCERRLRMRRRAPHHSWEDRL